MSHFNLGITEIPTYLDGKFKLYEIIQSEKGYPYEKLKKINDNDYFYNQLSLSDSIVFENKKRDKKIVLKIRIAQDRSINSQNVLEIQGNFYKVFNIYHFKNSDGYFESDITLEEYNNPEVIKND